MNADELRSAQTPLRVHHRQVPESALPTLRAEGRIGDGINYKMETGKALVGAGVTLKTVATTLGIEQRNHGFFSAGCICILYNCILVLSLWATERIAPRIPYHLEVEKSVKLWRMTDMKKSRSREEEIIGEPTPGNRTRRQVIALLNQRVRSSHEMEQELDKREAREGLWLDRSHLVPGEEVCQNDYNTVFRQSDF